MGCCSSTRSHRSSPPSTPSTPSRSSHLGGDAHTSLLSDTDNLLHNEPLHVTSMDGSDPLHTPVRASFMSSGPDDPDQAASMVTVSNLCQQHGRFLYSPEASGRPHLGRRPSRKSFFHLRANPAFGTDAPHNPQSGTQASGQKAAGRGRPPPLKKQSSSSSSLGLSFPSLLSSPPAIVRTGPPAPARTPPRAAFFLRSSSAGWGSPPPRSPTYILSLMQVPAICPFTFHSPAEREAFSALLAHVSGSSPHVAPVADVQFVRGGGNADAVELVVVREYYERGSLRDEIYGARPLDPYAEK